MAMWNPWRGCHKISNGCLNCYTHQGDKKRNIDTNIIVKGDNFYAPVTKLKNGKYKMNPKGFVYICFSSDFFLEEADEWRHECWKIIKERSDLKFMFLTKRITRFYDCIPDDWNDGYNNVHIGVSVENQKSVDEKIGYLNTLPIKHKIIILQPLLEQVNIEKYLVKGSNVVVGGEYGKNARVFHYDWVLDVREQCVRQKAYFDFRQCGSSFVKDGTLYQLRYKDLVSQAKKANINITVYK